MVLYGSGSLALALVPDESRAQVPGLSTAFVPESREVIKAVRTGGMFSRQA